MVDVVVVGNVGIDTCVYGIEAEAGIESRFTENRDVIGQAGGYCARGFRRLGMRVAFVGHVGDDPWGHHIRHTFSSAGIDIRALAVDPAGTARSINLMYADGRRTNYYDGKGHMDLEPDLTCIRQVLTGAQLVHLHLPNWSRQVIHPAREAGAVISCDLQDVREWEDPYRRDFIEAADILFFSGVNMPDPRPFMEFCFQRGRARIIIAGLGDRGCAMATPTSYESFGPVSMPEPVVDTNGAGDALAVGFLTAHVLEKRPLKASIQRAQIGARYTCTLKNGSDTLIDRATLEYYLN